MESVWSKYLKGDRILWAVLIGLSFVSIIALYTASSELVFKSGNVSSPIMTHCLFLLLGLGMTVLISRLPLKWIRIGVYLFLLLAVVAELLCYSPLGVVRNGAHRWVRVPFTSFELQPSEFVKPFMIMVIADRLSRIHDDESFRFNYSFILVTLAICLLPITISNLSTGIIMFGVVMILFIIAQVPWKRVLTLLGVIMVAGIILLFIGKMVPAERLKNTPLRRLPTWVSRAESFVGGKQEDTAKYSLDDRDRYQTTLSAAAIAHGRYMGRGIHDATVRDILPVAYADFIFAIIVEASGLWGAGLIIMLYLALLFRAGHIARKNDTAFGQLAVMGLALMLVLQAFVSMAVVCDIGPNTGQPLPLISRGGTSVLATCFYFGMMLAIDRDQKDRNEGLISEPAPNPDMNEVEIPLIDLEK